MTTNEKKELKTQSADEARVRSRRAGVGIATYVVVAVVAVIFVIVIGLGFISRRKAEADLKQTTAAAAIATVNVVYPKTGASTDEIVLPGNTRAFTDAPIYARTNGYLKRWYFDIGARVKKGQLLAEIETPEVDQQLQQARADLETAKSNFELARITAERYQPLLKSGVVSQQLADQAGSDFSAKKTAVDSAAANVRRLEQVQSFQKIYAPFDGVVTARNTDTGSLIDAGSAAQGKELFHLAALDKLRVFVG